MTRKLAAKRPAVLFAAILVVAGAALAQERDPGAADKSRFVRFVESLVSAPGRQVSLTDVVGVFSSHPTVGRITVSDARGVWLEVDSVDVVWNRSDLFRRRLDIDSLGAKRVSILRRPAPEANGGGGGFGLPIDVVLHRMDLPDISLAAPVAGAAARLAAHGSAELSRDVVAATLALERADRPGTLSAALRLEPGRNLLTADLKLAEPEGGLLADLLDIAGRPPVEITLAGAGPLADWRADLTVKAAARPVLAGAVAVARLAAGYRLSGDLAGSLESVAPATYRALLGGESRVAFDVVRSDGGEIDVASASLHSAGGDLTARGKLSADLVPQSADLSLSLGRSGRSALPFAPAGLSVASLQATLGLAAGVTAPWKADIAAEGLEGAFGRLAGIALTASGQASGLASPRSRASTFRLEVSGQGIALTDEGAARAVGPSARLTGSGAWAAGGPVRFDDARIVLAGLIATFAGTATRDELAGRFGASVADIGRFAGLSGRALSGNLQSAADGRVGLGDGGFDLTLDGTGGNLRLGIAALDPLLAGVTHLKGKVARRSGAFTFDQLTMANDHMRAELAGSFAAPAIDLKLDASVVELAILTPRAAGQASIVARVTGTQAEPEIAAEASGTGVVLMGRPLSQASARFSGIVAGPRTGGEATLAGELGGVPVKGSARLAAGGDGQRRLDNLLVTVGESRAAGALTLDADGLWAGRVEVVSPDLSKVAPLFLAEARGMMKAAVTVAPRDGRQSATLSGTATDMVYETFKLDTADIGGRADDLFGAPRLDGQFSIRNLSAGGLRIAAATGRAARQGNATDLTMQAKLADGDARLHGILQPRGEALELALSDFAFKRAGGLAAHLAKPSIILVQGGTARLEPTTLNVGAGSVTLAGSAGAAINLTAELKAIPAALANAFAPDLGAEGAISGTATVTGTPAAPTGRFDATWQGASVAAARNAGLGALAVAATGQIADGTLTLTSRATGSGGVALNASGTIGVRPGAPLALKVVGAVPLALGNGQLASRGAALQGALNIDVAVSGTAARPQFAGRVTSQGGGFIDPATGIVLKDVALAASVSGDRLVVDRLSARSGEGTVVGSGSIGLTDGFPADLTATVRQARYVDASLVSSRFDADLTLTGRFAEGPTLGGTVSLGRTEVTVPEQLPKGSVAVDVTHRNAPEAVERTLVLARNKAGGGATSARRGGGVKLNLAISAPRQIFVRGRGLDAELGGKLTLTGTTAALIAAGAFDMSRGRLDIFTQRVTFDRGVVTFSGDLDPVLDFSGTTKSSDIAITVTVSGSASDPQVTFSSVPELPQDEVLAHLIFNKGIGELSPVQIARLADAAAQISGATGGAGLLGQLRASTGLDDLDIVSDETGAPALAAGRYVSDNVYIGVQQGASAESSKFSVDLDITDDVKARAAVTPQGNSSLGVFFEKEY